MPLIELFRYTSENFIFIFFSHFLSLFLDIYIFIFSSAWNVVAFPLPGLRHLMCAASNWSDLFSIYIHIYIYKYISVFFSVPFRLVITLFPSAGRSLLNPVGLPAYFGFGIFVTLQLKTHSRCALQSPLNLCYKMWMCHLQGFHNRMTTAGMAPEWTNGGMGRQATFDACLTPVILDAIQVPSNYHVIIIRKPRNSSWMFWFFARNIYNLWEWCKADWCQYAEGEF